MSSMGIEAIAGIVSAGAGVVGVLVVVFRWWKSRNGSVEPTVGRPTTANHGSIAIGGDAENVTYVTADRGGVGIVGETSENIIITGSGTTVVRGGDYEAAAPTATSLHQLPPPPGDFTGRQAELDELMAEIEKGGATISGLRGMGGVGKTALALKLAEELAERYPDAQFYLDLKGTTPDPLTGADAMAHVNPFL